jgi:uncharacterized protein (TIGR02453 family)
MKTILSFLHQLEQNNNREWFAANKSLYDNAKNSFETFINILIPKLKAIDSSVDVMSARECVFRIYRDVRFSKDKNPYKTNFGAYMVHGGKKSNFAGYYFHVQPGNESFVGGGIYLPEPSVLNAVRKAVYENTEEFKEILSDDKFKKTFPELFGEKLKSVPRAFPKDFDDGELLKYKSYTVLHGFKDTDLTSEKFMDQILEVFEIQKPFNDFINQSIKEVLHGIQ